MAIDLKNELQKAKEIVLKDSFDNFKSKTQVKGVDFNQEVNLHDLVSSYYTTGYQATNLAKSVDIINKMVFKFNI